MFLLLGSLDLGDFFSVRLSLRVPGGFLPARGWGALGMVPPVAWLLLSSWWPRVLDPGCLPPCVILCRLPDGLLCVLFLVQGRAPAAAIFFPWMTLVIAAATFVRFHF